MLEPCRSHGVIGCMEHAGRALPVAVLDGDASPEVIEAVRVARERIRRAARIATRGG